MIGYAVSLGVIAGVLTLYAFVAPLIKRNKLEAILSIASKAAEIVEQETKRPEDETEEERLERQKEMKANAIRITKEIADHYGIKIPSDDILGYGVEAGVLLVNQLKKWTGKTEEED